jgi:hypothetical protein
MSMTFRTILIILAVASFCGVGHSQLNVDNRTSIFDSTEKDERPKNIKEKLIQMQIEKDKKDHDEMVARGEEAVKLSTELETSYVEKGSLTDKDLVKLDRVEKLVKKIRDELGGDDDDEAVNSESIQPVNKGFIAEAIDSLKLRSTTLLDELKKTTRFTISAAAITTSNSLLRITKFLRFRH